MKPNEILPIIGNAEKSTHWFNKWVIGFLESLFKNKFISWGLSLFYGALFVGGAVLCIYMGPVLQTYGTLYTCGMVFLVCGIMLSIYQTILNTASSEMQIQANIQLLTKVTTENLESTKQLNTQLQEENECFKTNNNKLKKFIGTLQSLHTEQLTLTKKHQEAEKQMLNQFLETTTDDIKETLKETQKKQLQNIEKMKSLIIKITGLVGDQAQLEKLKELSKEQDDERNPWINSINSLWKKLGPYDASNPQTEQQIKQLKSTLNAEDFSTIQNALQMILKNNRKYDKLVAAPL